MTVETILLTITLIAGMYMAWNIGANDVANAIGTSVGSGALHLKHAVILAACFEFCGAYFFGSHVSDTVQQGIVNPEVFSQSPLFFVFGMLSALIAAGIWLQIASYFGWPVSTTHSIVGAIVGFGAVVGGMDAVYWDNVFFITTGWLLSPLIGGILGYLIFSLLRKRIFYAPCPVEATKKITPLLVFVFMTTLSLIMMYQGLKNIDIQLNFIEAFGVSLLIGCIASVLTFILVQNISTPNSELKKAPEYSPEAVRAIEKARKHLKKVRLETTGNVSFQAALALEDVERLANSMKQREMIGSSDYKSVEKIFGYLQILSASLMAFSHGANDVANAIGPLSAALTVLLTGVIPMHGATIPAWTLALGGVGIVVGLATWGWRVIETIGKKITELTPSRGFSAEFGAALTIVFASRLGLPVSTTHTLVGAVLGVGLARGIEALNLNTTRDIFISWIVTVPAGAGISISCFFMLKALFT